MYCDALMDKSNKYKLSEDEIKGKLNHVMDLFDLVSDKDYFEEHYR